MIPKKWRFWRKAIDNRERILALDLLRGVFLIEIITFHTLWRPQLFYLLTGGNQLPASAAEGFFTISGLLVGYLYAPRILKKPKEVTKKLWKRAGQLYLLTVVFNIVLVTWSSINKGALPYDGDLIKLLFDIVTFQYMHIGVVNYLSRYAVFMAIAPLVVWLVAKHRGWVVFLASIAVWYLLGQNGILKPYSVWQVVFMNAIILGFYLPQIESAFFRLKKRIQKTIFTSVTATTLLSYFAAIIFVIVLPSVLGHTPGIEQAKTELLSHFSKSNLSVARLLLGVLWFAGFYMLFRKFEHKISKWTKGFIEVFGRQSLFVFSVHIFIIFAVRLHFLPHDGHTILQNTLVAATVLMIVYFAARYRQEMTRFGQKIIKKKRSTTQTP